MRTRSPFLTVKSIFLPCFVELAGAQGDDFAFLRLFLGGIGDDDAAFFDFFLFERLYEHAVGERFDIDCHVFVFLCFWVWFCCCFTRRLRRPGGAPLTPDRKWDGWDYWKNASYGTYFFFSSSTTSNSASTTSPLPCVLMGGRRVADPGPGCGPGPAPAAWALAAACL